MKIIKKLSPIMESISNVGKNKKELKEDFYKGGFPNFESFMDVVYEGETYGDHDVEFPGFPKTIDLIDSIWEEKYSDKETWDEIPFTQEEKDKIFKSAQDEAGWWDNMDLYNSHARYNAASIQQIKKAIRDAFNVQNKYLHENLKKKIDEDFDVNHPIGVLPHADAVAMEQHIADRAAGLERRANPDKDPLVKELIDETASEKSRTLHYDVVDRKGLAKILTEAKKNKCQFKVGRNNKAGYRYFVDIIPIYGSKGALEVDDESTEVDGETGEDLGDSLTEAKYKLSTSDSPEYINAMYKAYKELSKRKNGYAAVYGYRKGRTFVPFLALKDSQADLDKLATSLKTREKGQNDVTVYTLFKDNLKDTEILLKRKGLLESFPGYSLYTFQGEPEDEKLWEKELKDRNSEVSYVINTLQSIFEENEEVLNRGQEEEILEMMGDIHTAFIDHDEDALLGALNVAQDYIDDYNDGFLTYEDDEDLDEDLQLYASSLKDFKPAKEAEELWNEIVEQGKLDDLEFQLENVFKSKDDKNASIDIEALNDLLINHPDFIRTLIGLDDRSLEDDDYDEKPVGENEMVYYDDNEEPVDENTPLDDEEDDIDVDDIEGIDEDNEDDIEPIYGDGEEKSTSTKWKKIESDKDDESEESEPKDKTDKSETEKDKKEKKEEKVEESLNNKEKDRRKAYVRSLASKLKEYYKHDPKPELKLDDEEDDDLDDLEERNKDLKECDSSKDDDLTENIANSFVKNRFVEAKDLSGMTDEEKRQELARQSLASLNESDEEVVEINDEELTEALGMPTEDQATKQSQPKEETKEEKVEEKKGE